MTDPRQPPEGRLQGDLAIWFVIGAELMTFGLMFIAYAFARARERALFDASQATLDLHAGALNTVLLLTGSWFVARAVQALRVHRRGEATRWLFASLLCGAGFLASKGIELSGKFDQGISLSTNTFYMFYLMLTAFHFLHVALAVVLLALVWVQTRRGAYDNGNAHAPETAAAFWHMVDLLWIVLFPLLYVMR